MCLNSGGEMTTDKIFFQFFFWRGENDKGGKMTEGITVFIYETHILFKFYSKGYLINNILNIIEWVVNKRFSVCEDYLKRKK